MGKAVMIYTDGACSGNPGPGGWAAVLLIDGYQQELYGYNSNTTNNRMEMMAAFRSLSSLKQSSEVDIYTDSAYLCNAFNHGWLKNWQRRGWVTSSNKPVANKDLWIQLIKLCAKHNVTWHKVKGHSNNHFNNRCDELARYAIQINSKL